MKRTFLSIWLTILCVCFNPFSIETNAAADSSQRSKKGLQIDYGMLSDVEDLGVEEAFLNINVEQVLSLTETEYSYQYNGKTYYFNVSTIGDYDTVIGHLSDNDVNVTVAFLNSYVNGYEDLIYPGVTYTPGTVNYGFNTATAEGRNTVEAVCHFIADRYDGEEYGLISNYLIGNEVNDNRQYNYVGLKGIEEYVGIYYNTFKVFHDAILSENQNAKIYIPLEHRWATENTKKDYAARDFIKIFNSLSKADGSVDWNIAFHPYSYPLSNANVLLDGQPGVDPTGQVTYGDEVTDQENSPLVTMKNIDVLTDFLQKDEFLNAAGEVRSIILSEQGYTSDSNMTGENETLQAASIAYAYYKAEMNDHIDAFILNGHTDIYTENEFLKFGLWNAEAGHATTQKKAYNMYKYIDTASSLEVTDFALKTLGAYSWEDVIPGFDARKFENMGSIENGHVYLADELASGETVTTMSIGMGGFWECGYNLHAFSTFDHAGNYFPQYTAVVDEYANYLTAQSIEHTFVEAEDFSDKPYVGFTIGFSPRNDINLQDQVIVRIRFYSGNNIYDANCLVNASERSNLYVDLSDWDYNDSVDEVAVWIRKSGQKAYDGVFTVYNFSKVSKVKDATKADRAWDTRQKTISAIPFVSSVYAGVDYKDVYDVEYYRANNSDVVASKGKSPVFLLEHFVKYGMDDGRQASENFNLEAYKAYNPDLEAAYGNKNKEYYLHYINNGKAEGRTAVYESTSESSQVYDAVFDAGFYYSNNADVGAALGNDSNKLLEHFVNHGMAEGRQGAEEFDVFVYMNKYDDLRMAFGDDLVSYYLHYQNNGKAEGRVGRETSTTILDGIDYCDVFNVEYYAENNADVFNVLGSNAGILLKHFVNHGMAEGRQGSADFNVMAYKNNNPDVVAVLGENTKEYYLHYIRHGKGEGRDAVSMNGGGSGSGGGTVTDYSAVFDADYYYNNNPDVAAALGTNHESLLQHFLANGMKEGRQGCATFNVHVYKNNNADLANVFMDDLEKYYFHFIEHGKDEGRKAF